jgi:hypothetical protein
MANFEIQGPDGKTYEIQAPDIQSATAAFRKMNIARPPLNEDDRETRATDPTLQPAGLFPFSKVKGTGEVQFDQNAGLLGSIISGLTAPGDVATGKLDPNSPEAIQRSMDFTMLASPMGAGVKAAETTVPGTLRSLRVGQAPVPTAEQLKAAGGAGLNAARDMGVDYSAGAVKSMGDDLVQTLNADGFFPEVAPKTFSILSKIQQGPAVEPGSEAVASLSNLITLRKSLQKAAGDVLNPTEQNAASRAIDAVDNFIVAADPASVVAGPAAAAGPLLSEARGNYAAAMRSNKVADAAERAKRDADAANSGLNVGNRTRQVFNSLLKSDKESRGFSKDELALIDEMVAGKHGINLARWASNLLGGGGGLGAQTAGAVGGAVGGALGGFPGMGLGAVAAPAAGLGLKMLENKLTQSQARAIDEVIRKRSPLYEKAKETPPILTGISPEVRTAIMRALFMPQDQQR